jgi:hypothetical protein
VSADFLKIVKLVLERAQSFPFFRGEVLIEQPGHIFLAVSYEPGKLLSEDH